MYEQVFQFSSRPFTATPFVKHYFAAESIEQALAQTRSCIERGSGPAIVVGAAGTGKSLLLAMLEDQYRTQFNVVNLGCARLEQRRELLQSVLFGLQLPYKDMSETELRFSLLDYLKPSERCPNGILLLVDEAHTLTTDLLDEVRLIMNFVRDGEPRVRLVMAGNQRLEENLNDSKLDSFNQRIAARCYLQKMSRDETARYVVEHIDRAGGDGRQVFSEESLKAIHEVSDGCPRLVNQVCDQVLILIATQGLAGVTDTCVHQAWADVQAIPGTFSPATNQAPGVSDESNQDNWTVIEFGQLDGDDDEPAEREVPLEDHQSAGEVSEFSEILESFGDDVGFAVDEPGPEPDSITLPESDDEPTIEFVSEEPTPSNVPIEMVEETEDEWGELSAIDQQLDELNQLEAQLNEIEKGTVFSDAVGHELEDGTQADQDAIFKAAVESLVGQDLEEVQDQLEEESQEVPFEGLVFESENDAANREMDANLINEDVAEQESKESEVESVVEIDDPFSESFDDEEYLVDRYSPFVAHQNQSSLTVTSEDLALIQPVDQPDGDGLGLNDESSQSAVYQAEADEKPLSDKQVEASSSIDSLNDFSDSSDVLDEFESEETTAEVIENDDSATSLSEEEKILYELDPDPEDDESNEPVYHNHLTEAKSSDVEREAEEILKRLGVSCETEDADSSLDSEVDSHETSNPVVLDSGSDSTMLEATQTESDFEKQNAALAETQQILDEILQQKNLLAQQQDELRNESESSSASVEMPSPTDDNESIRDDREMIIVNQMEEQSGSARTQDESIPFPTTPVSTGRAERMDYQKLFEQLRDVSQVDE